MGKRIILERMKWNKKCGNSRFWAVVMEDWCNFKGGFCFTWDKKHPEDKREKKSVRVWAIYPNKKDALADAKFRGTSYVKEVLIKIK